MTLIGLKTFKYSQEGGCRLGDYLGIDISDEIEFFNIGNLERKNDLLLSYTYEGTEEEELKYDKIMEFEYKLHRIQMMDWYVTTFDGMLFIPLAIENASYNGSVVKTKI